MIRRFNPDGNGMAEKPDGRWVTYEDHRKALAQQDQVTSGSPPGSKRTTEVPPMERLEPTIQEGAAVMHPDATGRFVRRADADYRILYWQGRAREAEDQASGVGAAATVVMRERAKQYRQEATRYDLEAKDAKVKHDRERMTLRASMLRDFAGVLEEEDHRLAATPEPQQEVGARRAVLRQRIAEILSDRRQWSTRDIRDSVGAPTRDEVNEIAAELGATKKGTVAAGEFLWRFDTLPPATQQQEVDGEGAASIEARVIQLLAYTREPYTIEQVGRALAVAAANGTDADYLATSPSEQGGEVAE